jgi:transposase-like protein
MSGPVIGCQFDFWRLILGVLDMIQRVVVRYSMSFKRQVIEDLESGRFSSISEAQSHYGISGMSTIQKWLRKYGRNELCPKVVRVEKPDEKDQVRELKKQIRQLKEALGQTQAEKVIGDEFLKMACEDMGVDVDAFKKKVAGELFTERGTDQD